MYIFRMVNAPNQRTVFSLLGCRFHHKRQSLVLAILKDLLRFPRPDSFGKCFREVRACYVLIVFQYVTNRTEAI